MTTVANTVSRSRGATVTPVTNGAESDDPFGSMIIEDVPVAVVWGNITSKWQSCVNKDSTSKSLAI